MSEQSTSTKYSEGDVASYILSEAYARFVDEIRKPTIRCACNLVRDLVKSGKRSLTVEECRAWFKLRQDYAVRDINSKILKPTQKFLNAMSLELQSFAFGGDGSGRHPTEHFLIYLIKPQPSPLAQPPRDYDKCLFRIDATELRNLLKSVRLRSVSQHLIVTLEGDGETLTASTYHLTRGPGKPHHADDYIEQAAHIHVSCPCITFSAAVSWKALYNHVVKWKHWQVAACWGKDSKQLDFYVENSEGVSSSKVRCSLSLVADNNKDFAFEPKHFSGSLTLNPIRRKELAFLSKLVQPLCEADRLIQVYANNEEQQLLGLCAGHVWMAGQFYDCPGKIEDYKRCTAYIHEKAAKVAQRKESSSIRLYNFGGDDIREYDHTPAVVDDRGGEYFCRTNHRYFHMKDYLDEEECNQEHIRNLWRYILVDRMDLLTAAQKIRPYCKKEFGFTLVCLRAIECEGSDYPYLVLTPQNSKRKEWVDFPYTFMHRQKMSIPNDYCCCLPLEYFENLASLDGIQCYDQLTFWLGNCEENKPFVLMGKRAKTNSRITFLYAAKPWREDESMQPFPLSYPMLSPSYCEPQQYLLTMYCKAEWKKNKIGGTGKEQSGKSKRNCNANESRENINRNIQNPLRKCPGHQQRCPGHFGVHFPPQKNSAFFTKFLKGRKSM